MSRSPHVIVISSSPVLGNGLCRFLESDAFVCDLRTIAAVQVVTPDDSEPDLAIAAPLGWEELAEWISPLRSKLSCCPWLVLAEPYVVGMFASLLDNQPCLALDPEASLPELLAAARALVSGQRPHLPAELSARFSRHAPASNNGRPAHRLTPAELQCGCAVAVGLGNQEIARHLLIGEATVKSHVSSALRKLGLQDRESLAAFVRRAFHPSGRRGGERVAARPRSPLNKP